MISQVLENVMAAPNWRDPSDKQKLPDRVSR